MNKERIAELKECIRLLYQDLRSIKRMEEQLGCHTPQMDDMLDFYLDKLNDYNKELKNLEGK
ncbi:hypothetical protein AGMMS49982_11890 [Bacteroidia bacterium]|nr:hypothetical protein AGMMS49982_11890 [Bacteroidia bacterium]